VVVQCRSAQSPADEVTKKKRRHMKKFGFATIIAGGIVGVFLGLGAPAQAVASPAGADTVSAGIPLGTDNTHRYWLDNYGPNAPVQVPDGQPHPSH
jgi:hypothetical protein